MSVISLAGFTIKDVLSKLICTDHLLSHFLLCIAGIEDGFRIGQYHHRPIILEEVFLKRPLYQKVFLSTPHLLDEFHVAAVLGDGRVHPFLLFVPTVGNCASKISIADDFDVTEEVFALYHELVHPSIAGFKYLY